MSAEYYVRIYLYGILSFILLLYKILVSGESSSLQAISLLCTRVM